MAGHSPDDVTEFERETWNRCAQRYEETFALLTNEAVPLLVEAANANALKDPVARHHGISAQAGARLTVGLSLPMRLPRFVA
jgi:hypothetical protein